MKAVLLAGGFGTRLRPLTYTRPKPLLPVAGQPMMDHVLDRLPSAVDRLMVAGQWRIDAVRDHMDTLDVPFDVDVVPEDQPLGSGGAVRNCAPDPDGPTLVMNADIVSDIDLDALVRQHEERGAHLTIALTQVPRDQVTSFGVADMNHEDPLRIDGFVEKPATPEQAPSRWVNAGMYVLSPEVVRQIPQGRLVSLEKEIFPLFLGSPFDGYLHDGLWIDVGDGRRMIAAHQALGGSVSDVDAVVEDSVVDPTARIEPGAVVRGSVIGADAKITGSARVEDCLVGDGETVDSPRCGERIWSREVPEGYPAKQVGNAMRIEA